MATDNGPSSGNGEVNVGTLATAMVFIEQHVQGPVSSAISTGIPGGTSGPSSGLGSLGPADYATSDPTAYGTVSNGSAVAPIFNLGGVSAQFGPNNPSGAGTLNLFRMKNPA